MPWIELQTKLLMHINCRFGQRFARLGPAICTMRSWPEHWPPGKPTRTELSDWSHINFEANNAKHQGLSPTRGPCNIMKVVGESVEYVLIPPPSPRPQEHPLGVPTTNSHRPSFSEIQSRAPGLPASGQQSSGTETSRLVTTGTGDMRIAIAQCSQTREPLPVRVLPIGLRSFSPATSAHTNAVSIAVTQVPTVDDPWAALATRDARCNASRGATEACTMTTSAPPTRVLGDWGSVARSPSTNLHRLHWEPRRGIWVDSRGAQIISGSRGLKELQEEAPSPKRLQCYAVGKTLSGSYFIEDQVTGSRRIASISLQRYIEGVEAPPMTPLSPKSPCAAVLAAVASLPPRPVRPPPR